MRQVTRNLKMSKCKVTTVTMMQTVKAVKTKMSIWTVIVTVHRLARKLKLNVAVRKLFANKSHKKRKSDSKSSKCAIKRKTSQSLRMILNVF